MVGKRSTATSTPSEAGVCTKQSLNGQSTVKTKATAPEVSRRGEKPVEQSNTKATLYKAPHVRNATTSRANVINPPPIQTRVGRQIHTPARFVQLVHAVIAPNDIYCGPSARKI